MSQKNQTKKNFLQFKFFLTCTPLENEVQALKEIKNFFFRKFSDLKRNFK